MTVRAKFRVTEIKVTEGSRNNPEKGSYEQCDSYRIELAPVSGNSEENKKFFETTPTGSVWFTTVNPAAGEQFKRGREYYIDFTPAN